MATLESRNQFASVPSLKHSTGVCAEVVQDSAAVVRKAKASTVGVEKKPAWSRQLSIAIPIYRQALSKTKDSVAMTRYLISAVSSPAVPQGVKVTTTTMPRRQDVLLPDMQPHHAEGEVTAEWVVHEPAVREAEKETIVLYIHGGAYVASSAESHRCLTWRISKEARAKVLSINYRLAPENKFPLALHDAISAYLHLIDPQDPAAPRYSPEQIVIVGDSAGGGMALAVAIWLRDYAKGKWSMPAGIATMAPWLDLTHSQPSFRLNASDYLPESSQDPTYIIPGKRSHYYTSNDTQNAHPLVSPLFVRCDVLNNRPSLPPILIHVGELERLRDESIVFGARALLGSSSSSSPSSSYCKEAKNPVRVEIWEDQVHVFQTFAAIGCKAAERSLERMGEFVQGV
ncbi:hypothetical protein HK102_002806, partial [Quaeritorhiza haematococci]